MAPEDASDDGSEDFVDAPEQIVNDEAREEKEDDDDDGSMVEVGLVGREHRGEDMDLDDQGVEAMDTEEDLFESTFGPRARDDSSDDEQPTPKKQKLIASEHTNGCNTARGPATPPPPPSNSRSISAQPSDPRPPNPHKDRSWQLRRLTRFYLRAKELIPRLPLDSHRYWIGVLAVNKNIENFKNEADFVWMKGNRKSTVQTIWHMYQQSTAEEEFVLLLGHEKVGMQDCVEELDYFGSRKVIFRAVGVKHADAKGMALSEGIVPKDAVAAEGGGKKKVLSEVIVLDDD